ncbi:MAG: hypothetical protein M3498_06720, partial [Deinococcota bacterium]|nr:hypothetical protein [Deinococcota bacterium]
MSLNDALADLVARAGDPRGVLLELKYLELEHQEGALVGVAEERLAGLVRAFAERHGLTMRVCVPAEARAWLG